MEEVIIQLNNVHDIEEFSDILNNIKYEMDIVQGRYIIDAKSLMGLFSLDISMPLKLQIYCKNEEEYSRIIEKISKYIKK